MPLDTTQLAASILSAMKQSLAANWPAVSALATGESLKLAATLTSIREMAAGKAINSDTASILLDMQRHATRAVLMSIEGVTFIAAEQAINAALAVVAKAVDAAIGFPVL